MIMKVSDYLLLGKRLAIVLLFYSVTRIIFYLFNLNYFSPFETSETIVAFFYGLRFDVAIVCIANLFFILLSLIPFRNDFFERVLKWTFLGSNFLYFLVIFIDFEFFAFLGRKLTIDIFEMKADVEGQIGQVILYYWKLLFAFLFFMFCVWKTYPTKISYGCKQLSFLNSMLVSLLLFVVMGIGIRGGLQLRSISPKDAFVHDSYELGNFSLNAGYTMALSLLENTNEKRNFFKTDEKAVSVIKNNRSFEPGILNPRKDDNVIIVIVESFSTEYIEQGYAPFFSELSKKGLYFEKSFANGRRSIQALPSIMTGFPSLLEKPLYQTSYQTNRYYPLPKILKENGRTALFFHGGLRGTMEFNSYCFSIGFDQYFAKEDYPNMGHYDGAWGIYDHHFFDFMVDKLDTTPTPFLAGIFTLSSHQPYSVPKELAGKFPKGTLEIHESIGYADYSLKHFFDSIKDKPWFKNTLFVITADHTSKLETKKYNNALGRYSIPILYYHPSVDLNSLSKRKLTQQVDIMPSILDFLGIKPEKQLLFGASIFGGDEGRIINFSSGQYLYADSTKMVRFDGSNAKFYEYSDDNLAGKSADSNDEFKQLLKELKGYIQYTDNGLRNNNIYDL